MNRRHTENFLVCPRDVATDTHKQQFIRYITGNIWFFVFKNVDSIVDKLSLPIQTMWRTRTRTQTIARHITKIHLFTTTFAYTVSFMLFAFSYSLIVHYQSQLKHTKKIRKKLNENNAFTCNIYLLLKCYWPFRLDIDGNRQIDGKSQRKFHLIKSNEPWNERKR